MNDLVLVFTLAGRRAALPTADVQSVVELDAVTAIPQAPGDGGRIEPKHDLEHERRVHVGVDGGIGAQEQQLQPLVGEFGAGGSSRLRVLRSEMETFEQDYLNIIKRHFLR